MKYLQALLSLALLTIILYKISWLSVYEQFASANLNYVICGGICFVIQIVLNGYRLRSILLSFSHTLTYKLCLKIYVNSVIGGLVFAGSIGETTIKFLQLRKHSFTIMNNVGVIAFERLVAIFSIVILAGIGFYLSRSVIFSVLGIQHINLFSFKSLSFLLVALIFMSILLFSMRTHVKTILAKASKIKLKDLTNSLFASLLGQIFYCLGVLACLMSLSFSPNFIFEILPIIPIASFICAIPISLNGWGIRENLWAITLTYFSYDPSKGVALGMMIGILMILKVILIYLVLICFNFLSKSKGLSLSNN